MNGNNSPKSKRAGKEEIAWLDYLQEEIRSTPGRLEDAAKFISTIIGVTLSIFLAIMKSGDHLPLTNQVKFALIAWLFSLLLSLAVIFPLKYKCVALSAESIKRMHYRIVRTKLILLILSALLFLAALSILIFKLICAPG
jgi:hypothetical protein